MHNLSTVVQFEILRTLKKKSFWLMALGFPVMMGLVFGIIYLSNKSTSDAADQLGKQEFSLAVTDESTLVRPELLEAIKAKSVSSKQQGIDDVKNGKLDGYIYYPADIAKQSVEVYGKDVGLFDNGRYEGVAQNLLTQSVQSEVSPAIQSVIAGNTQTSVTTYRDGEMYEPLKQMILPGLFLILFYMLIAFFGNQMLTSTTEEKENRVIEMILTTIEARTLIVGKIISLIALAFFQGALIIIPALAGYLLFHDQLNIPALDLSTLPVDWVRILTGAAIFATGFILFTGLLVLIGASVPTAKEAGQFFGIVMILLFGPLYAFTLFISAPDNPFVRFLSLFPFTAPFPLLLRNAVGNLEAWEVAIAVPVMAVTAIIILIMAVRVFRFGALEYSRKLSIREIFSR
ncbi:MAG: ABC transporter permease [Candidatus Saccharimonas sp.]